jgi:hypothetical protein
MAVPSSMADMSTTAASNTPAGSESPTNADDYLRAIQAILRSTNAKGSDIASASSIDLGAATGEFVDVTGTTTITSLGTVAAGIVRTVRFTGALTLTHNATSLILPGSANITTANGDVAMFRSLGSGNWKCVFYQRQNGGPASNTFVNDQTTATPALDDYLLFADTSDSGKMKKATAADVLALGAPTRQMFTTAGSGTYTTPSNCKFIRVRMQGAGGGGGARVTNNGTNGGKTIFNSIEANGGEGGRFGASGTVSRGGAGGTGGAGTATLRIPGSPGLLLTGPSSPGGSSYLGFNTGTPETPNGGDGETGRLGSGGGGGNSDSTSTYSGGGGGAGEYVEIAITSPSASYSYTVGAGGAGATAGTIAGGAGGDGWIIVDEYY